MGPGPIFSKLQSVQLQGCVTVSPPFKPTPINKKRLHPQKLTWNLEMMVSNRNLLFQGSIFRFHVNFWGCNPAPRHSLVVSSKGTCCTKLKLSGASLDAMFFSVKLRMRKGMLRVSHFNPKKTQFQGWQSGKIHKRLYVLLMEEIRLTS